MLPYSVLNSVLGLVLTSSLNIFWHRQKLRSDIAEMIPVFKKNYEDAMNLTTIATALPYALFTTGLNCLGLLASLKLSYNEPLDVGLGASIALINAGVSYVNYCHIFNKGMFSANSQETQSSRQH